MTRLEATRSEAARARRPSPPRRPFSSALRDASRARGRAEVPSAEGPTAREGTAGPRRVAGRCLRPGGPPGEGERPGGPSAAAAPPSRDPASSAPAPSGSSLAAAVRAVPAAALAFQAQGNETLALDLGPALTVELRAAPAGVELVLRPAGALSRAAAAELPALLRALRARGVAVARAEVRARGPR